MGEILSPTFFSDNAQVKVNTEFLLQTIGQYCRACKSNATLNRAGRSIRTATPDGENYGL